jgi:hypothetical protein
MSDRWLFHDPPNVAVITTVSIMQGEKNILRVIHDEDDGGWLFLEEKPVSDEEAVVVSLRTIVNRDTTINDLVDLPLGWMAWREAVNQPWFRAKQLGSNVS